jgi:hypothetical protein
VLAPYETSSPSNVQTLPHSECSYVPIDSGAYAVYDASTGNKIRNPEKVQQNYEVDRNKGSVSQCNF